MKRLAIVTGSRAEWGVLRPFAALAIQSRVFETSIVAAGMHLLPQYGATVREIKADGFRIAGHVPMQRGRVDEGEVGAAKALGRGVSTFAGTFERLRPDLVLVFGDRVEPLAATLAAAYMNIPVAHDGGGDLTSTVDNAARHAISHFASLHTVATEQARERLERMGVPGEIHVTGSLALDGIRLMEWKSREETLADLGLPAGSRYLLVAFHPEPEHADRAGGWMDDLLRACRSTGLELVVTYPNSDPGSAAIIDSINRHDGHIWASLGRTRYLHALKYGDALVGNSSSGLYEAPSLCVPVVDVGHRQDGRIHSGNVYDCGYGYEEIRATLDHVLNLIYPQDTISPYGDGHAAERILALIEERI